MFIKVPFIPIEIHAYSGNAVPGGNNWSFFKASLVTGADAGLVRRETAVQAGFKSEHLLELVGEDDPTDTHTTPDGTTYTATVWGEDHRLSAQQVAARAEHRAAIRAASEQAKAAARGTSLNGAARAAQTIPA
jgi:hypothetical protein